MTAPIDAPPAAPPVPAGGAPFTGEIHPYADAFPMLDDESLKALAEDIAANGQRHPILLTRNGVLIDGRNRLRACEIAGVDPLFAVADENDDESIKSAVISENMQTRDLTKGQKAMIAVKISESDNQTSLAQIAGVTQSAIAEAWMVRKYAPHLVDAVIAGSHPHSRAYETAKAAKAEAESIERKMRDLQTNRPDLAELVATEKLTLDEALTIRDKETEKERKRAADEAAMHKQRNADLLGGFLTIDTLRHPHVLAEVIEHYQPISREWTADQIRELGGLLIQISEKWSVK